MRSVRARIVRLKDSGTGTHKAPGPRETPLCGTDQVRGGDGGEPVRGPPRSALILLATQAFNSGRL